MTLYTLHNFHANSFSDLTSLISPPPPPPPAHTLGTGWVSPTSGCVHCLCLSLNTLTCPWLLLVCEMTLKLKLSVHLFYWFYFNTMDVISFFFFFSAQTRVLLSVVLLFCRSFQRPCTAPKPIWLKLILMRKKFVLIVNLTTNLKKRKKSWASGFVSVNPCYT